VVVVERCVAITMDESVYGRVTWPLLTPPFLAREVLFLSVGRGLFTVPPPPQPPSPPP
jgi:hypothetical protein